MIPGSVAEFTGSQLDSLTHPVSQQEAEAIFTTGKAQYIEDYAQRMAPVLAALKASWAPAEGEPLLEPLRARFEPIMSQSDQICDGIGYPVELRIGAETVVLDFPKRVVREAIPDEKFRYGFAIAPELVRTVLRDDEPDWVNTIFLSTRFKAWRVGGYGGAPMPAPVRAAFFRAYPKDDDGVQFTMARPGLIGDMLGGPARAFMAGLMLLAGLKLQISSSIGIALFPEHGSDEASLLKSADMAMYEAKQAGRDNVQVFRQNMI